MGSADDNAITLTQREFDDLLEYSTSVPTGTTIGKRWKRRALSGEWWMGEYVEHTEPGMVGIAWRTITVAEVAISAAGSSPEDASGLFIDHDGAHSGSVSLNVWLPFGGSARVAEKCELLDETWEAVVAAVEGDKPEDAGERVELSEDERESIRAAMGDVAGHPFVTVVAAVERILAGRLAAVEQERVTLWHCPDCAFGFDAVHTDPDGGYSCPMCAEVALREQVAALRAGLATLAAERCESFTHGDCWHAGRTADAEFAADQACFPCRARRVLDADPASVLAQRDAEVGAKALEEAADHFDVSWNRGHDRSVHPHSYLLRERARGLRQGRV